MALINDFRYRPEIDGLRAIAVVAVVLFHAGFGCSGGYVGVDVFFVISGFLITSLIWKDLENGRFTFANFWERRARRIVPALMVVTFATLLAGWFLLLPADFKNLGQAVAAQSVFAANFYYWWDTGYFAAIADEKPLLHTWSLAVEEQFYLIMPFLLWGMFCSTAMRQRATVVFVLAIGFILSFALSVYGATRYPEATFYLLPARAWQLLLGALVAFLPAFTLLPGRRVVRELLALAGLILILIPIFAYTPKTAFSGLAVLAPCLGASLIIWANGRSDSKIPTFIGELLSLRPLVFTGLSSYSFYLWHWPLLAFSRYIALTPLSPGYRAAMVAFGFFCAVLSWKYVETPFRERRLGASRKNIFTFAGAGLTAILGCGLLCMVAQGFPQRFPAQTGEFAGAKSDMAFINQLTTDDVRGGRLVPIGATNLKCRPTILVWGDSHAMAALPAIDAFLREKQLVGRAATHSLNAPVLDWFAKGKNNPAFNDAVFSYIRSRQISDVILIANWSGYIRAHSHTYRRKYGNTYDPFLSSLLASVRRLNAVGARPWLMLDVPQQSFDVPKALALPFYSHAHITSLCTRPKSRNELEESDPDIMTKIQAAGGRILDPKPEFLDPTGSHYVVQANGIALYRDSGHLSTKGAKLMLLPLLRDSLTIEKQPSTRS